MSNDAEDDAIVYRFEPPFDGAHLRGVPQRDLTQRDVDRLEPAQARDAFNPHPLYGKPLYVKPGASYEQPKWFTDKQEKAGTVIEPMLAGETKAAYEARTEAQSNAEEGDADAPQETDA